MTDALKPSLAAEIRQEHSRAQEAFSNAVGHAIRCGQLLEEAKSQLSHGEWLPWLSEHFPASRRTAQGYMRLAKRAEDAQGLAHLGVEGALRHLADRRIPQAGGGDLDQRRVQHEDIEDELRASIVRGGWRDMYPIGVALATAWLQLDLLEEGHAAEDFGYEDFAQYLRERLPDVRNSLTGLSYELLAVQARGDGSADV